MKLSTTIVALMVLLIAVPASGQDKPFDFGIQGGVNLANLVFDPEIEPGTDMLMGFGGGAVLALNISSAMSLDIDAFYMQKGASMEIEENFGPEGDTGELVWTNLDVKMGYFLLIPMLRFTVESDGIAPYIMAGPEIGFLLNAKSEGTIEYAWQEEIDQVDDDVKDHYKDTSFGINVGAGLQIPTGSSTIMVEARYALGLSDIREDADIQQDEEFEEPTIKHTGIYLMAGIRF